MFDPPHGVGEQTASDHDLVAEDTGDLGPSPIGLLHHHDVGVELSDNLGNPLGAIEAVSLLAEVGAPVPDVPDHQRQ